MTERHPIGSRVRALHLGGSTNLRGKTGTVLGHEGDAPFRFTLVDLHDYRPPRAGGPWYFTDDELEQVT